VGFKFFTDQELDQQIGYRYGDGQFCPKIYLQANQNNDCPGTLTSAQADGTSRHDLHAETTTTVGRDPTRADWDSVAAALRRRSLAPVR